MKLRNLCGRRISLRLASLLVVTGILYAADDAGASSNSATPAAAGQSQNTEIEQLKATLLEQEKQLLTLQQTLQNQQALLEKALGTKRAADASSGSSSGTFSGNVQLASTSPPIPTLKAASTQFSSVVHGMTNCDHGGLPPSPPGCPHEYATFWQKERHVGPVVEVMPARRAEVFVSAFEISSQPCEFLLC
jgi:hypothetical protein